MPANPEQKAASKHFKSSPSKCIAAAKGGSKADIVCLSDASPCLTQEQAREFLRALCVHWKEPYPNFDPKKQLPDSYAKEKELAQVSLHALVSLDRHFLTDKDLCSIFRNTWPSFWKWMQYLYRQKGKTKGQVITQKTLTRKLTFALGMLVKRDYTLFSTVLLEDPSLVNFVIELWLKEDTNIPFSNSNPCYASELFFLFYTFFALSGNEDAFISRVTQVEKGGTIADRVLKPLQSLTELNAESVCEIVTCAHIVQAFMTEEDNAVKTAIFEKDGVAIASRLFVMLSKLNTTSPKPAEAVKQATSACVLIIEIGLQSKGAPLWVLRAIWAGLLDAFADGTHLFETDSTKQFIQFTIDDVLPKYLVYHSVLGTVIKSVNQLILANKEPNLANGPLKDEWARFMSVLIEHTAYKAFFDQAPSRHQVICNSCMKKEIRRGEFQACSGCKSVLYCSKECQTMAWKKFGHKNDCKLYANVNEEGRRLGSLDKSFLAFMVEEDLARHYLGLCELANRKPGVAGSPDAERAYHIDYTYTPPRLDVHRLTDLSGFDILDERSKAQAHTLRERFIKLAQSSDGSHVLCQTTLPGGNKLLHVFVPVELNTLLIKGKVLPEAGQLTHKALRPGCDMQGKELKAMTNSAEVLLSRMQEEIVGERLFSDGETVLQRIERYALLFVDMVTKNGYEF